MSMGAKFIPSGEYFINLYPDGIGENLHISSEVAAMHALGKTNKRIRLKVTNLGDTMDVFNVD